MVPAQHAPVSFKTIKPPSNQMPVTARIPFQLLHIASHFVHSDPLKQEIQFVSVSKVSGNQGLVQATDGHRAFRCFFPLKGDQDFFLEQDFLVEPKAAKKKVSYGKVAAFSDHAMEVYGGRGPAMEFLEARPFLPPDFYDIAKYPNLQGLWPDSYNWDLKGDVAFDAGYLASFLNLVAKYSEKGIVKMRGNATITPLEFETDFAEISGCQLQFLLMPVLVRG